MVLSQEKLRQRLRKGERAAAGGRTPPAQAAVPRAGGGSGRAEPGASPAAWLGAAAGRAEMGESRVFTTRAHVFQMDPATEMIGGPLGQQGMAVSDFYDVTRTSCPLISVHGDRTSHPT